LTNGEHQPQQQQIRKSSNNCEVFLGGSCNPTTWRTDVAIPELKKHGITFYNPQVSVWAPELVQQEYNAKQSARLLLFVVDSQTRSVAGMIEVAYLVAEGRVVVLVAYPYREGQSIMDEAITNTEFLDLVNAQSTLLSLVRDQGVKVHTSLATALQSTTKLLTAPEGISKFKKLREEFNSCDGNRTGEISVEDALDIYRRITQMPITVDDLRPFINPKDISSERINFDMFCGIYAELNRDKKIVNRPITFDIYLGGSCSSSKSWREQAVAVINENGLICFNPLNEDDSISSNNENEAMKWKNVIDCSNVLLFYITNDTRSFTSMILAAHCIGQNKNVVLCVEHLPLGEDDFYIGDEKLSKQAIKDYNRGRVYLSDLAKRKSVKLFSDIKEAVDCAVDQVKRSKKVLNR